MSSAGISLFTPGCFAVGGVVALAGVLRRSVVMAIMGLAIAGFAVLKGWHRAMHAAPPQAGRRAPRAEPPVLGSAPRQVQRIVSSARVEALVEKARACVAEIIAKTTQPFPAYAIIGIRIEPVDGSAPFAGTMNLILQQKPPEVALHGELEKSLRDYLATHEISEFKVGVCFAAQVKGEQKFDLRVSQGAADPSCLEKQVELEDARSYRGLGINGIQQLAFGFFPVFEPAKKGLGEMLRPLAVEGVSLLE